MDHNSGAEWYIGAGEKAAQDIEALAERGQ